jgi:hypothetical protein
LVSITRLLDTKNRTENAAAKRRASVHVDVGWQATTGALTGARLPWPTGNGCARLPRALNATLDSTQREALRGRTR